MIASGPTREPLDPVRFLSNQSTGTIGRYLVEAARAKGHRVTWINCPETVQTALELQKVLSKEITQHDVLVMAAAVCDVRPAKLEPAKIKKDALRSIRLVKNPDILAGLGKKKGRRVFIGFGIESHKILENGYKKLKSKKLDLIVIQEVTPKKIPFGDRPVTAYLLTADRQVQCLESIPKQKLARVIVREAERLAKAN